MDEAKNKATDKLWDRSIKIDEELKKLKEEKEKLEQDKKLDVSYITSSNLESRKNFYKDLRKEKLGSKSTWEDYLKYIEYLEKETKLLKEKETLEKWSSKYNKSGSNLFSDELKAKAKERSEMTETDKIYNELAKEQEKLDIEMQKLKKQEEEKRLLYNETIKQKEDAEKYFSEFITKETDGRLRELEKIKDKAIEVKKEMQKLGFSQNISWAWFLNNSWSSSSIWNSTNNQIVVNNNINQVFNKDATNKYVWDATLQAINNSNKGLSTLTTKK